MILSHKEIEEIAVAVTKDFNEFFFGPDTDGARLPRGTPIDQFASEYLGLNVSFADLSADGRSEERRVGKECRSRWSPYH